MMDDTPQQELLEEMAKLLKRFEKGGNLASLENRDDWNTLFESQTSEERELLQALARFSDLWRYLQERDEKLGRDIVDAIFQVHRLPILQRISELKAINQKLMERIDDAHQSALRH